MAQSQFEIGDVNKDVNGLSDQIAPFFIPTIDGGITDATMDAMTTPGSCKMAYFNHSVMGQGWGILFVFMSPIDYKWGAQVVVKDSGVYTRRRIDSTTWTAWNKVS